MVNFNKIFGNRSGCEYKRFLILGTPIIGRLFTRLFKKGHFAIHSELQSKIALFCIKGYLSINNMIFLRVYMLFNLIS